MKAKRILSTCLIAMFILSVAMLPTYVSAVPYLPLVDVEPSSVSYNATSYCQYNNTLFTVEVKVYNVTDLYGYDLWVKYNSTLLQKNATAVTGTGQVVPSDSSKYNFADTSVSGTVKVSVAFLEAMGAQSFNGSGTLLWITFKIIYCPPQLMGVDNTVSCALDIDNANTFLYDHFAGTITIDTPVDGSYVYTTKGFVPGAPTADFTWSPQFPQACTNVTLTDTSDPGMGATIISWKWTIVNGTGGAHLTGPDDANVTTFHCDGEGTVFVTLNVTNSNLLSDDVTKTITQISVLGAVIDLYTSQNRFCDQMTLDTNVGKGPDQPCDALTDDVNVTLYAKVTWGGAPVMHVLVAFEVWWNLSINWQRQDLPPVPKDECVLYRTAETDKDGIAQIWFRVPTPCTGRMHGKWVAIVKAKIQDDPIQDMMRFDVGWLLTLTEFPPLTTDKPEYIREVDCVSFNVTVKSIAWIPKELTLIAVIYDDCDVPIGQYVIDTVIPPGYYCSPNHELFVVTCHLPVPQWAYVGIGKLYVSAFTALPRDCGIAYCPEVSATFVIKYVP